MICRGKFYLKAIFICIISSLLLIGCQQYDSEQNDIINKKEIENETITLEKQEKDYTEYLQKTWITQIKIKNPSFTNCSFYITEICDENISRRFCVNGIAQKGFSQKEDGIKENPYMGSFSGSISDNTAKCDFYDNCGIGGRMELTFLENGKIKATIDCQEAMSYRADNADIYYDGVYFFDSWNLADIPEFTISDEYSLNSKIGSFYNIELVGGEIETDGEKYPTAFLTDEKGNILYQFNLGYFEETSLSGMDIRDINEDGLEDIMITLNVCNTDQEKMVPYSSLKR